MSGAARLAWLAVGLMLAVGLFFLLRPDPGDDAATTRAEIEASPVPTTKATTVVESQPPPAPTQTHAAPRAVNVTLVIENGRPVGGRPQRLSVIRGRTIALTIRSDVADELHVHGYDVKRAVSPGRVSRLDLEANLVGRFEIELEGSGVVVAELEVRP